MKKFSGERKWEKGSEESICGKILVGGVSVMKIVGKLGGKILVEGAGSTNK